MQQNKYFIIVSLVSLSTLLFSCSKQWIDKRVVSLYAKDTVGTQIIRGSGYMSGDIIFTSAHVVPDDRWTYFASGEASSYRVYARDIDTDRAILNPQHIPVKYNSSSFLLGGNLKTWTPVYALVLRSGWTKRIEGKIIWKKDILWYTKEGKTVPIKWVFLTDMEFLPWESWSPVFDIDGNLIDVVHVGK